MADVIDDEIIKAVLQDGIEQVNSNLSIESYSFAYDKQSRELRGLISVVDRETAEALQVEIGSPYKNEANKITQEIEEKQLNIENPNSLLKKRLKGDL